MFTLHNGDCLQVLPSIPSGSIDAIITDLPYGTTACKWDTVIEFAPMWKEVKRVLKPNGVFITTASQPFTSALVMSNPSWFRCEWIWKKNRPTGVFTAKQSPMKSHENIIVFSGMAKHTYNPQMEKRSENSHSKGAQIVEQAGIYLGATIKNKAIKKGDLCYPKTVQSIDCLHNYHSEKLHPTRKPVELYEYLIKTYTNEGETILDICMGSGTTIEAASRNNRNSIGIEKDKHYFEVAERRLNNGLL